MKIFLITKTEYGVKKYEKIHLTKISSFDEELLLKRHTCRLKTRKNNDNLA